MGVEEYEPLGGSSQLDRLGLPGHPSPKPHCSDDWWRSKPQVSGWRMGRVWVNWDGVSSKWRNCVLLRYDDHGEVQRGNI